MEKNNFNSFPFYFHFVAVNRLSADSETIEDLRRLCVVFEHVEKLLTVAASLHRKLIRAPRLSREIFNDYYNFYIPTMGTGLTEDVVEKVNCFYASKYLVHLASIPQKILSGH